MSISELLLAGIFISILIGFGIAMYMGLHCEDEEDIPLANLK